MNTSKRKLGLILVLGMGGPAAVNAAVLHNNLTSIGAEAGSSGVPPVAGSAGWVASAFSTGSLCPFGCTLGNITLRLLSTDGSTTGFTLQIFNDGGTAPGATLIGTMNNPAAFTANLLNNVFTPQGTITLAANTTYWVRLFGDSSTDPIEWAYTSGAGRWADSSGNFDSGFPNMMKVDGTPLTSVPIPAAVWLLGSALAGLAVRGRKAG
jgi:hypothetical protein